MTKDLIEIKDNLISELDKRLADKIIEKTNADLLKKLIKQAETINEAIMIAELGTTYKRTGFHFDKRLEKMTDTIKYFKKNEKLSFVQDKNALTHKLIIGDNYDALLNLLIEYRNKIDVIYIDPPYGKDSMGEFAKTNYQNAINRDNLLSMLYPRLVLARQLLSDNGVIFCSIDDKNQAYVKGLFDEVFGESNFVGTFIRKTKSMTGDDGAGVNIQHDYLLSYAKNKINLYLLGDKKTFNSYSNDDNDQKGDWVSGDPTAKSGSSSTYFPIKNPYTLKEDFPPQGRYWAFSQKTLEKYIKIGKIKFKNNYLSNQRGFIFKRYKVELKSEFNPLSTLDFIQNHFMNSAGTVELMNILEGSLFNNPKPKDFIKKILQSLSSEAVILDFFAGSGTTGQAVLELNKEDGGKRQFILATANEITDTTPNGVVNDVTSKRLKRVMTGEDYDGTNNFKWLEKNKPLGDNLDVYDIEEVSPYSIEPFEKIDESLYGQEKLNVNDKIKWVCENFEKTQKKLDNKQL